MHDVVVHAILHLQQRHALRLVLDDTLHERLAQSTLHRGDALHRRRQLTVVAGEDDAVGPADGYPTGGLERLRGLVDEERGKLLTFKQTVSRTHQGAGDDTRLAEELRIDAYLQFGSPRLQPLQFLVIVLAPPLVVLAQFAYGLAYGPQLRIVGMGLEAALIGEAEHLVIDACGIADAQHVDAAVDELLADPVDGHIALRANQHLTLAHQRLVDGLDERRGLAGAWRTVHHLHILGPQHLVDGPLLRLVEPGKRHGVEAEPLGRHIRIEQVAQVGQPVALGVDDAVEGIEHRTVARLVKRQLYADGLFAALQVERVALGNDDHHAVAIDIRHGAGEREIADAWLGIVACAGHAEEEHGLAELEVMGDILVGGAENLNSHLIERVVERRPYAQRKPRIAPLHLAPDAHGFGLLAKRFLLGLIFYLEQQTLLL